MHPESLNMNTETSGVIVPPNPLLLLHRYLRGRYWLIVPLAILFAIPGAIGGYLALKPQYEAYGRIAFEGSYDWILDDSDRPRAIPAFDARLNQAVLDMHSYRVVRRAAESDDLVAAGWPVGEAGYRLLRRSLSASVIRNSNTIDTRVSHPDPVLAAAAANSVIKVFMEVSGGSQAAELEEKKNQLISRRERKVTDLELVRAQRLRYLQEEELDEEDLEFQYPRLREDVANLSSQIQMIELELAKYALVADGDTAQDAADEPTISDLTLASRDPTFARLLGERDYWERKLATTSLREGHREYRECSAS